MPHYCAVIRTLGTAGNKYQQLLDSLVSQSHKPDKILVYLAEGYPEPSETVGIEQIVYVPKGMVAQRALPYDEVNTEWMLMLDDDLRIETDGVERLFKAAMTHNADVVAYDPFPHDKMPLRQKIIMALLLTAIPRIGGKNKGYTVTPFGTDCYNNHPQEVGWSTTNAGAAFICRKNDFLKIKLENDLWLDQAPYALPEDKVTFYKMHLAGLKILTHFNAGFTHLDAGSAMTGDREARIAYSGARNNRIFYKLYVEPHLTARQHKFSKAINIYRKVIFKIYHGLLRQKGKDYTEERMQGLRDAENFLIKYRTNDDK